MMNIWPKASRRTMIMNLGNVKNMRSIYTTSSCVSTFSFLFLLGSPADDDSSPFPFFLIPPQPLLTYFLCTKDA